MEQALDSARGRVQAVLAHCAEARRRADLRMAAAERHLAFAEAARAAAEQADHRVRLRRPGAAASSPLDSTAVG